MTLPAATLDFYASGTSTRLDTYSNPDLALIHVNANPVVADSGGLFGPIYLQPTAYSVFLKTSAGAAVWNQDPVLAYAGASAGVTDLTGTAGEALAANDAVYLSDGSGSLTAGRWYRTSSSNAYSSTLPLVGVATAAISSAASGLIRIGGALTGFSGLTTGQTYYLAATAGTITVTAPAYARILGYSDSTTELIISPSGTAQGGGTTDVVGTAGETLTAGDCCYLSDGSNSLTAGRWYKADADFNYASVLPQIGFAVAGITSAASGLIRLAGSVTGLSGLTAGTRYFISATAGSVTATAPSLARCVGVSDSTTSLVVGPDPRPLVVTYPATLSNVTNTNTITTALTFVVPANTWADGQLIVLTLAALEKNNHVDTGVHTMTLKCKVTAGGADVTVGATSWANSATEFQTENCLALRRVGSTVWIKSGSAASTNQIFTGVPGSPTSSQIDGTSTPTNFTSDLTVTFSVTPDAASTLLYLKPQAATVVHYRV